MKKIFFFTLGVSTLLTLPLGEIVCWLAKALCYKVDFKSYLESHQIKHFRGSAYHSQAQGQIERYHRSMKNVGKLDLYYSLMEQEAALE